MLKVEFKKKGFVQNFVKCFEQSKLLKKRELFAHA